MSGWRCDSRDTFLMIYTKKLPYFADILCQTGYHFSSVIPFRLFTCCAGHAFTAVCSILSISLNNVHASDAYTFMLLRKSRHCNFHRPNYFTFKVVTEKRELNICSKNVRWWPNRNAMGHQEQTEIIIWYPNSLSSIRTVWQTKINNEALPEPSQFSYGW